MVKRLFHLFVLRLQSILLLLQCAVSLSGRGQNFSTSTDSFASFSLGRGDFYLHPDFISSQELNMLRLRQHASLNRANRWPASGSPANRVAKCSKGAVLMSSDEELQVSMTHEEIKLLDDIRQRIALVVNNITIGARAYDYKGEHLFPRHTGFFSYNVGGCHKVHADTDDPGRVVTTVLGLNDAHTDYGGGLLKLYDQFALDREENSNFARQMDELCRHPAIQKGDQSIYNQVMHQSFNVTNSIYTSSRMLVVFLSENLHEIEPVTRGTRHVMLQWLTSYPHLAWDQQPQVDAVAQQQDLPKQEL